MKVYNEELGFYLTDSPDEPDVIHPVPDSLSPQLDKIHRKAIKGKKYYIPTLLKLIDQYPDVPLLKNHLQVLYTNTDQPDKAEEVLNEIISKHPDYFFGKIGLATKYINEKKFELVPDVLGESFDLKALYPERQVFHIKEVTSMLAASIIYYCLTDQPDKAREKHDILMEIAPDSPDAELADNFMLRTNLKAALMLKGEYEKQNISVEVTPAPEEDTETHPPEFNHPEIQALYDNGFDIAHDDLKAIIDFPRKTLMEDLEKVINDGIARLNFFYENGDDNEFKTDFVLHALFILGEIKEEKGIDLFFETFSQSQLFLNTFFGDILTEMVWEPLYKTANQQLPRLKEFMQKPGVYTHCKTTISRMVAQIARQQPERREEVLEWFNEVFEFYLTCSKKDNILDSELNASMICDLMDIGATDMIPSIKKLFAEGLVAEGFCGSEEEVLEDFLALEDIDVEPEEIGSIYEQYVDILDNFQPLSPLPFEKPEDPEDFFVPEDIVEPTRKDPKIGRNDLCPCGSGKKYKKCCLNN
ncbi:DUF1186 domain-containing protein [Marinilabilia rubra]|uniref:DUF1186 domain-containing protein n=1 Tax=Marinilabilia rubra TaxID=2162893 RepID=UPI0018E08202|nr:DUF1186 domain-containing protein [Marinilabilia rubra]